MGVTIARTRFLSPNATGNQTITTTDCGGLTPKAALFFMGIATTDGVAADGYSKSVGMTDGTTHNVSILVDQHGVATSVCNATRLTDRPISIYSGAGSSVASAFFVAWTTNGITVNWNQASATSYLVEAVFFCGSDLTSKVTNTTLTNAVDTDHDVNTVGFQPDVLINFLSASFGISTGLVYNGVSLVQQTMMTRHRNGRNPGEVYSQFLGTYGAIVPAGAYASDTSCFLQFGTFDADGFTVTTRNAAPGSVGVPLFTLSLNFGGAVNANVYTYTTPTSTGSNTDTGAGFQPQFVMYLGSVMEAVGTLYTTDLAGSSGISTITSGGQHNYSWSSEDNVSPTNTQSLSDDQAINLPLHGGATGLTATFSTFTSAGVTLSWDNVTTNGKKFIALAIEAEGDPEYLGVNVSDSIGITESSNIDSLGIRSRPIADAYVGSWTNEEDSTINLYDSINEEIATDADYIQSEENPSASAVVIKLDALPDPPSDTGHYLRYRIAKYPIYAEDDVDITVEIRQDYISEVSLGTLIASWTHLNVPTEIETFQRELTETQAGNITDYTMLYVRFVATLVTAEVAIPAEGDFGTETIAINSGEYGVDWDGALWGANPTAELIYFKGQYFFYYVGMIGDGPAPEYEALDRSLGVATSPDLINWTKYSGNPIVTYTTGPNRREEGVGDCAIVVQGDTLHMWYSAIHYTSPDNVDLYIRYRTSTDGLTWTGDTLVLQISGQEHQPSAAFYDGTNYNVYSIGDLTSGLGPIVRRYGTSPTSLTGSETALSGSNRGFGQWAWLSKTKAVSLFRTSGSSTTRYVRTMQTSSPGTLSSSLATWSTWTHLSNNLLYLDERSSRWFFFGYDTSQQFGEYVYPVIVKSAPANRVT